MKKKIVSLFVGMLLFVTVFSVTGTMKIDENEAKTDACPNPITSTIPLSGRAPWDIQFWFDCNAASGAGGNAGSEFDGTYFYSTRWASNLIHKYDITGNLVDYFSIPGVTGLRDLAYDGEYFYGGNAGTAIYQMDFETETLIDTITSSVQVRAIAYDDINDAFYVSNWNDPVGLIARDGTTLDTFNLVTATSTYGFAYDNVVLGGPYLWVFDQGAGAGMPQYVHQWDLAAGQMTGESHDVAPDFGSGAGIAGGLFFTTDYESGYATIGGLLQDSDAPGVGDYIFCYEFGEVIPNDPPETPSTPDGETEGVEDAEYTYTTNTTDPDGNDVYYWFDWDNGDDSGWVGPYPSGDTGNASYAWPNAGVYNVTVKAKDEYNAESGWSDPLTVTIEALPTAELEITEIAGGMGVTATIKNIGETAATNLEWNIVVTGGFLGLVDADVDGNKSSLAVDATEDAASGSLGFLHLGGLDITVTADADNADKISKDYTAFIIGPFVISIAEA